MANQRATSDQLTSQMRVSAERRASGDSLALSSTVADAPYDEVAAGKVATLKETERAEAAEAALAAEKDRASTLEAQLEKKVGLSLTSLSL